MQKNKENEFYDLLSKKLSGDATTEELLQLEQLLSANPKWQFLYNQMIQVTPPRLNDMLTEQAFAAHVVKMELSGQLTEPADEPAEIQLVQQAPNRVRKKFVIGALVATLLAVGFFGLLQLPIFRDQPRPEKINEIVTKKGSKSMIRLPDGTQVWLNSDTRLTYAESFGHYNREVHLDGEAFFDVTHDSSHPFIIQMTGARIKVLGTAFNVRNYTREQSLEATLVRGKIEFSFNNRPNEQITLKPMEKLVILKDSNGMPGTGMDSVGEESNSNQDRLPEDKIRLSSVSYAGKDSLLAETSWISDKMVFDNQTLENIAKDLEINFGVTVVFQNEQAKKYRYTGVYENQDLEKILSILRLSKKINYSIDSNTVTIK